MSEGSQHKHVDTERWSKHGLGCVHLHRNLQPPAALSLWVGASGSLSIWACTSRKWAAEYFPFLPLPSVDFPLPQHLWIPLSPGQRRVLGRYWLAMREGGRVCREQTLQGSTLQGCRHVSSTRLTDVSLGGGVTFFKRRLLYYCIKSSFFFSLPLLGLEDHRFTYLKQRLDKIYTFRTLRTQHGDIHTF